MLSMQKILVLRDLASQHAKIAALPIHAAKRQLWTDHNEFRNARPMVLINQICWWEIDNDDWFQLRVTIDAARRHNRNVEFILKDIAPSTGMPAACGAGPRSPWMRRSGNLIPAPTWYIQTSWGLCPATTFSFPCMRYSAALTKIAAEYLFYFRPFRSDTDF